MRPRQSLVASIAVCGWVGAAAANGDAASDAAPAPAATDAVRWPRGVIDRPLTLPGGLVLAGPDVLATNTLADTMASSSSFVKTADVAIGYGVTDDLEINTLTPTYGLTLDPKGTAKGAFDVGAGLKLLRGALDGKLELIARAVGGYDLSGSTARPIRLGVQVQYNATPRIAMLSHDVGIGNAGISIGVDGMTKPIFLTLPVGIGLQVTPELWLETDTSLVPSVKINSDASNAFITDVTPVFVTGIYNTLDGRLDLLAYVGFNDLQHAGDTVFFGAGARYYVGKL